MYEGDLCPRRHPGLYQELLGFGLVELVGANLAIAEERRGHGGVHGFRSPKEHVGNDGLFIDRVVERLPHVHIIEPGLLRVDGNKDGAIAGRHQHVHGFVALQGWQVSDRRQNDQIDLARE